MINRARIPRVSSIYGNRSKIERSALYELQLRSQLQTKRFKHARWSLIEQMQMRRPGLHNVIPLYVGETCLLRAAEMNFTRGCRAWFAGPIFTNRQTMRACANVKLNEANLDEFTNFISFLFFFFFFDIHLLFVSIGRYHMSETVGVFL